MSVTKKLGESDISYAVMYILLVNGGSLRTSAIIELTINLLEPEGPNQTPLLHRNDNAIHQIIRNIVSHRSESKNNIIYCGYVTYTDYEHDGIWTLTASGRDYLNKHVKNEYTARYN